ncbi:MAG: hypothetical protein IT271_04970 [Chitinophagales bacterium]|nr:hypothetical protein [Chitinophagales bacterium]
MKTIKLITLLALVIFAASCKKDKQKETLCKVTTIITGNDSMIIQYNSSNKVSSIRSINTPDSLNMSFVNDGIFHKQTITENNAVLPAFTINYSLNAAGSIDKFQQTIINIASVYVNNFRCKYDNEGHLIIHENKVTKSGFPFSYKKDSSVYENGNMTKLYRFRSLAGDTTSATLYSTTLITYTVSNNTLGLYANQIINPNNIEGTSTFYLNNFPYILHLYGKGNKNLPASSATTFSSGAAGYTLNYEYTIDSNNLVTSQTINRTPTAVSFPKISRFYYACN